MEKQILAFGSGKIRLPFMQYLRTITGKECPRICFIPTASGDDKTYIISFFEVCKELKVKPYVLEAWVNSYEHQIPFEDLISKMDAIVVGGGNTLNMLAIWNAQGIDEALRKAYLNGCVMAGGSAGSLCWFNGGTTDSRPKELSIVHGMSFIDNSHCPHYNSELSRRPLYHKNILEGSLSDGYACDDQSAIHFINGAIHQSISLDPSQHSYWVYRNGDEIIEEKLPQMLIKEGKFL